MKIQKGDKVVIIAGKDRNKVGVIERVLPKENKVVVTGVNIVKKHLKRSQQNPQGGIIDKVSPIHASNVMLLDGAKNKPTRVGYKTDGKEKVRYAKLTGDTIKREEKK
jgi:large subunit ribosomal protein L24